jgi:CheY-like chemotaxis protein
MVATFRTILLADDDADDAEMFALVLAEVDPGVVLRHVINGEEVFEAIKEKPGFTPDVIFLDLNMPRMNGWQCLEKLKADAVTKDIPVVIYTTSSHTRDKQVAFAHGATAFITKPSDYKALRALLLSVIADTHPFVRHGG